MVRTHSITFLVSLCHVVEFVCDKQLVVYIAGVLVSIIYMLQYQFNIGTVKYFSVGWMEVLIFIIIPTHITLEIELFIGIQVSQNNLIVKATSAVIAITMYDICLLALSRYTIFPFYFFDYMVAESMQNLDKVIYKFQTLSVFIKEVLQQLPEDVTITSHRTN